MNFGWCTARIALAAIAVVSALGAAAALPFTSSADPSLGQLNSELGQQQARQQSLSASVSSLGGLIASLDGQIALVQGREAEVRAELAHDRVALAEAVASLNRERQLVAILRARLAHARMLLARQLVSSYENSKPDIVAVVLEAHGFADLLDRITYLRDAEQQQQQLITATKAAKASADSAARRLAKLEATDQQITDAAAIHAQALAGMNALLSAKEGALQKARAAQQAALAASQTKGRQLQAQISKVQAQQAAAQQAAASFSSAGAGPALGPSGGWAIPYAIVLCESGGQNLPPNSAGASGYYQIVPGTWKLFGGTGPAADLASKAEQDAVASRIWNGGAGASNWVCAGIVGIH
jgi:predicted  nucleic acid-binding Zn-ribbon protein